MSHSLLIAFFVFAAVMYFTPGPNNIMVLSSGLTYGFRPTLPHIAGITVGCAFMVGAVGLGFGTIFVAYPVLQTILKYAGAAYLIYLAVAIAISEPVTPGQDHRRGPMTFWGAVLFQWVNVKGWVMVIGTITAYAGIASFPWNIVIQVVLCLLLGGGGSLDLGAVRQLAARAHDLAEGGAGLQPRDGRAAAGLALPGLHGGMMSSRAMQKRVSPERENALDNAGNSRAPGGLTHLKA
jgi:threonine/homoserine/homoserine lactone efflux protein